MLKEQKSENKGLILLLRYLSFLMFIFTLILLVGNTKTHDYIPYMNNYYGYIQSDFESGYTFISEKFNGLGISFDIFKLISMGTGLLLINYTALKFLTKKMLWTFYLLYLIYPLVLDTSAIRNTLAMCIVIYAIPFLSKDTKKDTLIYTLLIFVASLFHMISLIYLLLLLIKVYDNRKRINKKISKVIFIFLIFNMLLMIVSRGYTTMVLNLIETFFMNSEIISNEKSVYFDIVGNFGFLIYIFYQLLSIFCLKYVCHFHKQQGEKTNNSVAKLYDITKYIFFINLLMLIISPLYRVNSNFFRIYRNITPINHMAILSMLNTKNNKKTTKIYGVILIYFLATIALAYIQIEPMKEIAVYTLFTDNWIINLFK